MNWDCASCSTTMVMEKTRPVTEIIALAMVERRPRAPSGPPWKTNGISWEMLRSSHGSTQESTRAANTMTKGSTQNGRQIRCHRLGWSRRGTDPRRRSR